MKRMFGGGPPCALLGLPRSPAAANAPPVVVTFLRKDRRSIAHFSLEICRCFFRGLLVGPLQLKSTLGVADTNGRFSLRGSAGQRSRRSWEETSNCDVHFRLLTLREELLQ